MRRAIIALVIIAAVVVGFRYVLKDTTETYQCEHGGKTVIVTLDAVQPFPPMAVLVTFSDGHVMRVSQDDMKDIRIGQTGTLELNCKDQVLRFNIVE